MVNSSVLKRSGNIEKFSAKKLRTSLARTLLVLKLTGAHGVTICNQVADEIESWIGTKEIVTSHELRLKVDATLYAHLPEAGDLYSSHRPKSKSYPRYTNHRIIKRYDALLIGTHPVIEYLKKELKSRGLACLHEPDAKGSTVRILQRGVVYTNGTRASYKRALVISQQQKSQAPVHGLKPWKSNDINLGDSASVALYGHGPNIISTALLLNENHTPVAIYSQKARLLEDYDTDIEDALKDILLKRGIQLSLSSPLLSVKAHTSGTELVLDRKGAPHRTVYSNCYYVSPADYTTEVGVENVPPQKDGRYKDVVLLKQSDVLRHQDFLEIADFLSTKKSKVPSIKPPAITLGKTVRCFQVGTSEIDIKDAHSGHRVGRSKIRKHVGLTGDTGLIKIITTRGGKVIGASGVVSNGLSAPVEMLALGVRLQLKTDKLMALLEMGNPVDDALADCLNLR